MKKDFEKELKKLKNEVEKLKQELKEKDNKLLRSYAEDDNNVKRKQKRISLLIIGLTWIALGLFGLIFDPSKTKIIISQLVLGGGILIYYFWKRLSQGENEI